MNDSVRQETMWMKHDTEDQNNNRTMKEGTKMDEQAKRTLQPADGCLDWDAEISGDLPENLILPEGDYQFHVTEVERGRHEETDWMPACPQATVILEIAAAEGTVQVRTVFYLHGKGERKLTAFFRAIGFQKKGQPMKMNWPGVPGAWGRAHFRPRTFTGRDGQEHQANGLAYFIDFDPDKVIPGYTDVSGDEDIPF